MKRFYRYDYDDFGRIIRIDYPQSSDILYVYGSPSDTLKNQAGRVIRVSDADSCVEYEYGCLGETIVERKSIASEIDGLGRMKDATMSYQSDYLGRMQKITYPDGEAITYSYNYGGEVESVKGIKQGTVFTYVEKIGYDEWGQRVYLKLGNGVETMYRYDENRRWLDEIYTAKGSTVLQNMSYTFDDAGNVGGYVNDTGSYTAGSYRTSQEYGYDSLYQLTSASGKTMQMSYNGVEDYHAEYHQEFMFDSSGLGKMLEKKSSAIQSDSRKIGDDLNYTLDYEYEEGFVHRVKRIGNRYYQYDANGNVIIEQEEEIASDDTGITYTIQELENDTYVVDYGWAIEKDAGAIIGNKSAYRRTYEWNERNLLTGSSDSRYRVSYRYGHDGERIGKYSVSSSGGSPTETLYFNKMWTWRYNGLQSDRVGQNSKHIYLGDTRILTKIARADGSFTNEESLKQYYYHSDHLGSAQLITNADGQEYERIEYTPYGELWVEKASALSNIDIPYRFTGKEMDEETGLYYYGARYLDPKTSRWLSADPALGEYIPGAPVNDEAKKRNGNLPGMGGVFNTVNLHLYHYAGNNPVKYVDPTGMCDEESGCSVSFIIVRSEDSNRSTFDRTQRGLDRIEFKNFETGDSFVLFDAQTYVSYFNSDGELAYPVGNTISPFSEFALQYLGNNQEAGQSLYNKQGSNYKGPVFNVQNAQLNGGSKTNDLGQIPGDSDTAPIRVHSDFQLSTDREVPLASGGCPMYNSKYTDSFVEFLERNNVKPGDVMKGYIREYFYP